MIRRFVRDARGATAIEYALIATLIAIVIVTGLSLIGTSLSNSLVAVNSGFTR